MGSWLPEYPWSCPLSAPTSRSGAYPILQRVCVDEVGQHVAQPQGEDVPKEPWDEAAAREETVGMSAEGWGLTVWRAGNSWFGIGGGCSHSSRVMGEQPSLGAGMLR